MIFFVAPSVISHENGPVLRNPRARSILHCVVFGCCRTRFAFIALVAALAAAGRRAQRMDLHLRGHHREKTPISDRSSFWRAFIRRYVTAGKCAGQHQRQHWSCSGVPVWVLQLRAVSMRAVRILWAAMVSVRNLYRSWPLVRWSGRFPRILRSPL